MTPDHLERARAFLLELNNYDTTLALISDRIGPELLNVMQTFVDHSFVNEEARIRQKMVGFLVIGFLLRSHLERVELDDRTSTDGV